MTESCGSRSGFAMNQIPTSARIFPRTSSSAPAGSASAVSATGCVMPLTRAVAFGSPSSTSAARSAPVSAGAALGAASFGSGVDASGYKMVTNPDNAVKDLDALGFAAHDAQRWEALVKRPHGIILVTGPTGSGKTTTLYAALSRLDALVHLAVNSRVLAAPPATPARSRSG